MHFPVFIYNQNNISNVAWGNFKFNPMPLCDYHSYEEEPKTYRKKKINNKNLIVCDKLQFHLCLKILQNKENISK